MKTVSPHLLLHRQGVPPRVRDSIIAHRVWIERLRLLLIDTREIDHDGYVLIRAHTHVFDLIEAGGEAMIDALTERGTFTREEITRARRLET